MCKIYKIFFLLSVLLSTCVVLAQNPRFPLPNKSDEKVFDAVSKSISKTRINQMETEVKSIIPNYSAGALKDGKFQAHPLSCDGPNEDDQTEQRWKFDSVVAMFGKASGEVTKVTERFLGCFEPIKQDDKTADECPITPVDCRRVIGTPYEICNDPPVACPGNCCAAHPQLLAASALPWELLSPYVAGAALNPTGPSAVALAELAPFLESLGGGCNVPFENKGYNFNFWWPENEIEVQNYERTVFNPTYECRNTNYKHKPLTSVIKVLDASLTRFKPPGIKDATVNYNDTQAGVAKPRIDPHIGESHWAGMLPGDQTFVAEAHVYRTYVDVLGSLNSPGPEGSPLGYKRDCDCFYSGLQDQALDDGTQRQTVNGWTEESRYLPFWRYWQKSRELNQNKYEALEKYQTFQTDTCAFLRAWDDWGASSGQTKISGLGGNRYGYADLYKALGIWPPPTADPIRLRNELLRICYRGGGDLFPITGQLIGHFSPLPASAYIARRALYLFGTKKLITGKQFVPPERRINRFSDMDDKMQRIYPLNHGGVEYASHCYRGHEIPNYLQEGTEDWPRDIIRDALTKGAGGPKDTARFLHWNKRGMCMCPYLGKVRGLRLVGSPDTWVACRPEGSSCRKRGSKDIGDYEDNSKAPLEADNGNNPKPDLPDGIPFPFLPFSPFKMGIYEARPILKDDPATSQIVGGDGVTTRPGYCELTKKVKGTHVRVPEDFEDVRGKVNEGGIQCNAKDYRCAGGVYTPPKDDPILPNDRPVDPTTGEDSSRGDVREQIDCSNFEPEAAACRETLGEIQSLEGQELVNVNNQLATSPGAAGSVWLGTQTITYSGGGGLPMVINIGVPRCSYSDQAQAIRCGQTSSGEFCSFGPNPSPGCIQR